MVRLLLRDGQERTDCRPVVVFLGELASDQEVIECIDRRNSVGFRSLSGRSLGIASLIEVVSSPQVVGSRGPGAHRWRSVDDEKCLPGPLRRIGPR